MIYDITRPLVEGMRVYDGHERYCLERTRSVESDGYCLSHISMGAHCGSHMDAPAHFLEGGATVDAFPVDLMVGRALLLTADSQKDISGMPAGVTHVLLRSGEGYRGLSEEDAYVLVQKDVRLVGTDRLSVAIDGYDAQVHKILLNGGVWIVENLDLSVPPEGDYELICLPLNLVGVEGAPIRAILRKDLP